MRIRFAFAAVAFAAACAGYEPKPSGPLFGDSADGRVRRAEGYLLVSGSGKPDPRAAGETQRRSTSRDAAILDARARLIEYLRALPIDGASLGQRAASDARWDQRLAAAAQGVEVAETKWDEAGGATVLLRVEHAAVRRAFGLEDP